MGKHIDPQMRVADSTQSETDLLKSQRQHKVELISANGKIRANPSSRVADKVCEGKRAAAAVAERHRRRPSRCFTRFPARVSV